VNNRYRKTFLLTGLLFLTSIAFSQDVAFKNANFKEDKQGLKLAKESIDIADEMRDEGIEKILLMQDANIIFSKAIFNYNKAQRFNPNNGELNYKIGSSLLFTNQKEKAYSYLVKAKELSVDLPSDFLFYYAMTLAGRTPFMFLMIGYLLLTTGELFISPIGLSKVTELSPKSMTAFMMGVYFLSSSYAHYISGAIAKLTTSNESGVIPEPGFMTTIIEKVTGFAGGYSESSVEGVQSLVSYTSVFTQVGVVAIGMAILAFILSPVLKKWMHGVH